MKNLKKGRMGNNIYKIITTVYFNNLANSKHFMEKTTFKWKSTTIILVIILGLFSCDKKFELYEEPDWLGGSSIETLEKKGNYTSFLKLMDKAEYTISVKNQLNTLFVPDDEAFKVYFKKINKQSVDDLTKEEAYQLFALHILKNPRNTFNLRYEFAWGEFQGPNGEYASTYFRKPTQSKTLPYYETVQYFPQYKGQTLLIHDPKGYKNVPLITIDLLEDLFASTDGSDYELIYPESTWGGLMQWHNARVIPPTPNASIDELANRTANGFIYYIDQVVAPIPSLEEYLKNNPDFSLFYNIVQRFATYSLRIDDKTKMKYYKKGYKDIFNFAEEQGPNPDDGGGWNRYGNSIFTMFAPKNDVLQAYLNKTVLKYYSHIDSVPDVTISYILNSQMSRQIEMFSKISKRFTNSYGEVLVIKKEDIGSASMCSNGIFYGTNRIIEPNVFSCVPGRLFFDANYSTFLNAVRESNILSLLADPNQTITLFAPDNDEMLKYGIRYEKATNTVQTKYDGVWTDIDDNTKEYLLNFCLDHVYFGTLDDLSGEGFIEMKSGNFVYYNNNKLFGGENQNNNSPATIDNKTINERNGLSYDVSEPVKCYQKMGSYIYNNPDLSEFAKLMVETGLLTPNDIDIPTNLEIPNIKFLTDVKYTTAFIPNNDAMAKAKADGIIPSDPVALKRFVLYHFIKDNTIFDDGRTFPSNTFVTYRSETSGTGETVFSTLNINNAKNNLSVTDNSGQTILLDHAKANKLVYKGVVHTIPSVFKY